MTGNETLIDIAFPCSLPFNLKRDTYTQFLDNACTQPSVRTLVISLPVPCDDPLRWLKTFQTHGFGYYWEKPDSSSVIAACGNIQEYTGKGPHRFDAVSKQIRKAEESLLHLNISTGENNCETYFVGGFSFFDELNTSSWQGFAPASFTLPEYLIRKEGEQPIASIALNIEKNCSPEELHQHISQKISRLLSFEKRNDHSIKINNPISSNGEHLNTSLHDHSEWIKTITDAKEKIGQGIFKKVVLGRQLKLQLPQSLNAFKVLHRLRTRYPKCITFYIQKENSGTFIGSSPELLLSVDEKKVQTEALAGSIARGTTEKEDRELESTLLQSVKDKQEHEIVVNHIKKLLTPFVENIEAGRKPVVKKLANVQHLRTPIGGSIQAPVDPYSILSNLHPTPAVGGTPRETALPYIARNELFDRGWFAGPIGWVTSQEKAEFAVAIRSGLINENTARLFAGCGIVADSDPETEWQETNLKFMPMLSALNYD